LIKLDKIYTRGGDTGKTSLGDGQRVSKNSLRLKAYGDIDELNSCIGISLLFCSKNLKILLKKIQNQLFDIGADLCKPYDDKNANRFANQTNFLELELDKLNEDLSTLNSFILPGGTQSSAFLHLARTVSRRAERSIIDLLEKEKVNPTLITYINRLSDFLFVAARFENREVGDILWIPEKKG
jgi:cob(I)alamin adenosyltransferase